MSELNGSPGRLPTWAQCRAAAASVRTAEFGAEALAAVRPRGVLGLIRSRGPLPLMLAVAARDSRLVWQGVDGFAMLETPLGVRTPVRAGGIGPALLRFADRHWEFLVMGGPPLVLLPAAVVVALMTRQALPSIMIVLVAVAYVCVLLLAGLITGILRFGMTFGRRIEPTANLAEEARAGTTWSVVLCHSPDRRRGAELLRAVAERVVRLVRLDVQAVGQARGAGATRIDVHEELACRYRGVTTSYMRRLVEVTARDRPYHAGDDVVVLRPGTPTPEIQARQVASGSFLFWYLGGLAVAILVCAEFVADAERQACLGACAGRPDTYREALRYLGQRLLWSDPSDLHPATDRAYALGWLTSLLSLMLIFVAFVAVRQYRKIVTVASERRRDLERKLCMRSKVLLVVATKGEHLAVRNAVARANHADARRTPLGKHTVFDLGTLSDTEIVLAQTGPGTIGVTGSTLAVAFLVDQIKPHYTIMVGVCFGLRDQPLGDILVAQQLKVVDHLRVTDAPDGLTQKEMPRGDKVSSSQVLLDRLQAAEVDWTGASVHFGLMLSTNKLVDSAIEKSRLLAEEPEAIGGEMEGAGLYAAAAKEHAHWILVKAVSDHGERKTDEAQALAARNAAEFVIHAIRNGLLDLTARWDD